ncbi:MAG: hypothetical protein JST37_14860 [Bacteroidetes bacterium]|nr:hypothetical protein [Bacteroidota bacterium]MBS1982320.1 hypothetical protein [Bacteroidota bacterium]
MDKFFGHHFFDNIANDMDSNLNDEIDLRDLFFKILRYFLGKKKLIAGCVLIGGLAGIIVFSAMPKIYESKMLLRSDILTESYSKQLTEDFFKLIDQKNTPVLSKRLSLSEQEASLIDGIIFDYVKSENPVKTGRMEEVEKYFESNMLIITVWVKDNSILNKLQPGIIQFLQSNPFVKVRVERRKQMFHALIKKLDKEIKSLDSLKQTLFKGVGTKSTLNPEMVLVDPSNIYTKLMELTREKISYKNELELIESIQLIEGFTAFEKPLKPNLSKYLVAGLVAGLALAALILLIQPIAKELKANP